MKKNIIFLILIISISCKPSPTYNAFDKEFDISIRDVKNDGCEKITVGCGFYNLQQKKGRLRNYYQVYVEDLNDVVAKGFVYFLDTLKVKEKIDFKKLRLIEIQNKDIIDLNKNLKQYGYKYSRQVEYEYGSFVEIENETLKDTIRLSLSLNRSNEKDLIIYRELDYFVGKPK